MGSKKSEAAVAVIPTDVKVGNEELISIRVAAFERNLLIEAQALEKTETETKAEFVKLTTEVEKAIKKLVDSKMQYSAESIKADFAKFGFPNLTVEVQRTVDDKKKRVLVRIEVAARGGRSDLDDEEDEEQSDATIQPTYGHLVGKSRVIPYNDEVNDLIAKREAAQQKIISTHRSMIENKKKQSQIATVERQARAALAQGALEKTKEGRALLAQLDAAMPSIPGLLELPAPKV